MSPSQEETASKLPYHIGIIMDGNGRWAKAQGKNRLSGHKKGAEITRDVVRWAKNFGIKQISLYAFSTENWRRPKLEVRALMSLLAFMIPRTLPEMMQENVRFCVLGDITPFPRNARKAIEQACEQTQYNDGIDLILCLNYGGQQEILAAMKTSLQWALTQDDALKALDELSLSTFRERMWCHDLAPLDFLIRTGGEKRISNFYLWDSAYTELYFTDVLWPDFSQQNLQQALEDFQSRERRFGLTSEQVQT
ncbi:MAG: di-trans,poly-cis-decaprenylcistransferase [Mariprofundus sp.]|nr:di-trans,poly-cis-decaprenylcistransferase [Mariprofundus sp.]